MLLCGHFFSRWGCYKGFNVTRGIRNVICSRNNLEDAKQKAPAHHGAAEFEADDAAATRQLVEMIWPSLVRGTFAAAMVGGASRHLPYSRLMATVQGFYEPLYTENTLRMGEQKEQAIGGSKIKARSSLSERRISADANAHPTPVCLQYRSSMSLISGILFLRANGASVSQRLMLRFRSSAQRSITTADVLLA